MKKSHLSFTQNLPSPRRFEPGSVLIFDKIFETKKRKSEFRLISKWIRQFPNRYGVRSGEKLKNLDQFPQHYKKILKLTEGISTREITIVTLGGGSVSDFGGFVASVLKRGVNLIHVPSTWLAAVDSAHGGKNGLNVAKLKNQIGSFYSANKVILVRSLLFTQPDEIIAQSLGETIKIALINGGNLWEKVSRSQLLPNEVWKLLPELIRAKQKIVEKDPYEKRGLRQVLNLGHTLGHVIESQLKMPHGDAVLYGLGFALEWSLFRRTMSSQAYYAIRFSHVGSLIPDQIQIRRVLGELRNPKSLLLQDKKISSDNTIRFVFLRGPGRPIVDKVKIKKLLIEVRRQS